MTEIRKYLFLKMGFLTNTCVGKSECMRSDWHRVYPHLLFFFKTSLNENHIISSVQASLASSKSSLSPVSKAANSKVRCAMKGRTYSFSVQGSFSSSSQQSRSQDE